MLGCQPDYGFAFLYQFQHKIEDVGQLTVILGVYHFYELQAQFLPVLSFSEKESQFLGLLVGEDSQFDNISKKIVSIMVI